jgi:hypothetical protein
MIELDKTLRPICYLVNECYSALFPKLPGYPEFSISRAMATFWKIKVFNKLQINLFDVFKYLLTEERNIKIKQGQSKTKFNKPTNTSTTFSYYESKNFQILNKFVQAIADISINEVKIHMLGSTKLVPDEPYMNLHEVVMANTK